MRAIISETDEGYCVQFQAKGQHHMPPHLSREHYLFSNAIKDAETAGINTWTRPDADDSADILIIGHTS